MEIKLGTCFVQNERLYMDKATVRAILYAQLNSIPKTKRQRKKQLIKFFNSRKYKFIGW